MATKKVPIGEASASELRAFARETLGLEVGDTANKATITAQITAAWDKDFIIVAVEPTVDKTLAARRSAKEKMAEETADDHPEEVWVNVQVMEEAGGDRPVELSVNGKIMLVPRGKDVKIPWRYYEVLKNAVQHFYDPLPEGGVNPNPRKVLRYPFQRVA